MTAIFIVSGGTGFSGEQLLRTALAQFPEADPTVGVISGVRRPEQLETAVARAAAANGLIVHTLVDAELRLALERLAAARGVLAVDLMGPLLARLQMLLGQEPAGRPMLSCTTSTNAATSWSVIASRSLTACTKASSTVGALWRQATASS